MFGKGSTSYLLLCCHCHIVIIVIIVLKPSCLVDNHQFISNYRSYWYYFHQHKFWSKLGSGYKHDVYFHDAQ